MAQGTRVIRSSGSTAVWLLGALLVSVAMTDLALSDLPAFRHAVAPTLLVLWVLGMVLARPCVRFDDQCLVVVNPGVIHEIGWAAVEDVTRGAQVVLHAGGRRITAWGTPPPPRTKLVRRPRTQQLLAPRSAAATPRTAEDRAYQELDHAWQRGRSASSPLPATVVRRLDLPMLATGLALVIATVAGFAL